MINKQCLAKKKDVWKKGKKQHFKHHLTDAKRAFEV